MSKKPKEKAPANKKQSPIPGQPEKVTAVLVPVDVFSELTRVLSGLPYNEVGNLMTALGECRAQEFTKAPMPGAQA